MAGVKISALPVVASALLTDIFPAVQAGVTSKETLQQVATLFNANLSFLPLAGGTMQGPINMGTFAITNASQVFAGNLELSGNTLLSTDPNGAINVSPNGSGVINLNAITNVGNLSLSGNTLSSTNSNGNIILGPNGVGLVAINPISGSNVGVNSIINDDTLATAAADNLATSLAIKTYIDSIASGFHVKGSVKAATTVNLSATYDNGAAGVGATLTNNSTQAAFAVDGYSASVNDRILIKNQSSTFQNGIYTVTTVGDGSSNWVLTRATDYDQPSEIQPGDLVIVLNGTTQDQSSWLQVDTVTTIGTDPIQFDQFSASIPVSLANGGTGADLIASNGGIFYSTASAGAILSGTSTARQMLQSGASSAPAWSTTTWPATTTANQILYSSATSVIGEITTHARGVVVTDNSSVPEVLTSASTTGQVLQGSTTGAPTWSTPTYPSASGSAGKILRSDGTNNVYSTSLFADTYLASNILFSSGADNVVGLATLANAVVITDGSGVPEVIQTLPIAVQTNITELGTVTVGTWNGTVITGTYGGTGINNGSSTITIGGSVTFSGAFTFKGDLTGNTEVTFPTSGTLATTAGTVGTINGTTGSATASAGAITINGGTTGLTTLGSGSTLSLQGTLAIANGGTAVTSVTIAPAATAWAGWDANKNLSANNIIEAYATTATAGATTTLTVGSAYQQYFTGSTTQTVQMPDVTTLVLGQSWWIVNNSTGVVTVNSSGSNSIQAMVAGTNALVTCIALTGTGAASWNVEYTFSSPGIDKWTDQVSGTITMVSNNGYTSDDGASLVTFTLPTTSAVGDWLEINGKGSGLWKIAQASGQQIQAAPDTTTLGATGFLASVEQYDNVRLRCLTANTIWTVVSQQSSGLTVN